MPKTDHYEETYEKKSQWNDSKDGVKYDMFKTIGRNYVEEENDYDDEYHFEQVARNNMVQDDDFKEEFTYDINNNIDSKVKLERKDYQEDDQIDQAAYQDDDQIIFM